MGYGKYIEGRHGDYSFEIWCKDWIGDIITPDCLSVDGLSLNGLLEGDLSTENRIVKSSLDISFKATTSLYKQYFDRFFTADATKFSVLLKDKENIIWSGYITPDSYSYTTEYQTAINITARDNFGYLEQIDFDLVGFKSIQQIIDEALNRIAWQGGAIEWFNEYAAEGNVPYHDAEINCDVFFVEKTWWEVLNVILVGYQLRYVGNNSWKIINIADLADCMGQIVEYQSSYDSASLEVIPSWKTFQIKQEWKVIKELFEYKQSRNYFNNPIIDDRSTPGWYWVLAPVKLYENKRLSNGRTLSNFDFVESDSVQSEFYDFIFIPAYYDTVNSIELYSAGRCGAKIKISVANYGVAYSADLAEIIANKPVLRPARVGSMLGGMPQFYEITANINVRYKLDSGQELYLNENGWSSAINTLHFSLGVSRYANYPNDMTWNDEIKDIYINIISLPEGPGRLFVDIIKPTIKRDDGQVMGPTTPIHAMAIKKISIGPALSFDGTGLDITGKINEVGNIKESLTVEIGETPMNSGGVMSFGGGLFKNKESLSGWHRADNKGGILQLSEHIGRAYAHASNAFIRNDEVSGGLTVSATVPFNNASDLDKSVIIDNNKYIFVSHDWNIIQGRASIKLRQTTPYYFSSGVKFESSAINTSSGFALASGEKEVITWSSESGEVSKKRIYELPAEEAPEGAYLLVDKSGALTAKKYSIDNIFLKIASAVSNLTALIAEKFDKVGGFINGVVKIGRFADGVEEVNVTIDQDGNAVFNKVEAGKITSNAIQSPDYQEGLVGKGFSLRNEGGRSYGEVDVLEVRQEMKVNKLTIQEMEYVGGNRIEGPAKMEVSKVEDTGTAYRCYFDSKNGKIKNYFKVNDQARCHEFDPDGLEIKFYWRVITAIGEDWIELAKSGDDLVMGSGVPAENDVIGTAGNKTDKNRQAFVIYYRVGPNTPRDERFYNVNSFVISDENLQIEYSPNRSIIKSAEITLLGGEKVEGANTIQGNVISAITVEGGAIDLSVKSEVGKVQVGATNLLSKDPQTSIFGGAGDGIQLNSGEGISTAYHKLVNGSGSALYRFNFDKPLIESGWYSISFWWKHVSGLACWITPRINDSAGPAFGEEQVSNTWRRYEASVYVTEFMGLYGLLDFSYAGNWGEIWISDIMVVWGNKPMPWNNSVKDTATTKDVDDIQAGGVNLIPDSKAIGILTVTSTTPNIFFSKSSYFKNLVSGINYMVSFDARNTGSGGRKLHVEFWGSEGGDITIESSEWKRYGIISRFKGNNSFYLWMADAFGSVEIKNLEFSTGTLVPDWSAAPEDIPNALRRTGINIESGKIVVTSDNTIFQNSVGQQTLSLDQNGVLTGGFFDILQGARIGSFNISGNQIVGNDPANGEQRLLIANQYLPSLSQMIGGGEESVPAPAQVSDSDIQSGYTYVTAGAGSKCSVVINISRPSIVKLYNEYGFNTITYGAYDRTETVVFVGIKAYKEGSESNPLYNMQLSPNPGNRNMSLNIIDPGLWHFELTMNASEISECNNPNEQLTVNATSFARIKGWGNSDIIPVVARKDATFIGLNGVMSIWGSDQYFAYTRDEGFETKFGTYGMRVTSAGIQKWNNNLQRWENANI